MTDRASNLPESLRRVIAADIEPVTPLPPPWVRVLWAVPLAVALTVGAWLYFGMRPDLENLGPMLSWVPLLLQASLGIALLIMALHETVPGLRISRGAVFATSFAALALHLSVNLMIWLRDPMGYDDFWSTWWGCFRYELLLGVPFLAGITYLAARALPIRPQVIGLLSGIGAGVIADASWRLVCPVNVPMHFLTAHLGGILVLGSAGFVVGRWVDRRLAQDTSTA